MIQRLDANGTVLVGEGIAGHLYLPVHLIACGVTRGAAHAAVPAPVLKSGSACPGV